MFTVGFKGRGVQPHRIILSKCLGEKNCKIPPEWLFFKQVENTAGWRGMSRSRWRQRESTQPFREGRLARVMTLSIDAPRQ